MAQTFEFVRRAARLRALLVVTLVALFSACDATDKLTSSSDPAESPEGAGTPTEISTLLSYRGGIPMGHFALPTSQFGADYNGAMRNIWPGELVKELSAIRARGGRVVLMMVGHERHYKTGGKFDLAEWKQRVNRYRGINFQQFINDGTIIAHYLIDEPNDPANWGRSLSGATLEEMARYSKNLWPGLPTVVRAEASYLAKFSTQYRALDAAWAQYVTRKGPPSDFIRRNVADAQKKGLALITGLNISKGGPNGSRMSASTIKSAGTALLNSSYPCAFISWTYDSGYLSNSSVRDAMRALRNMAQNRGAKSCRS
jgi:hypothetical protein